MQENRVRDTTYSGSFYPSDPDELRTLVDQSINDCDTEPGKSIAACIVPHAGYEYSGKTSGAGYSFLRNSVWPKSKTVRVFLLGPSHQIAVSGIALSGAAQWNTPLGTVPVSSLCEKLADKLDVCAFSEPIHAIEHSLEVQIPFLQRAMEDMPFEIIPMLISDVPYEKVTDIIEDNWDDTSLLCVSTDLSHYYPDEVARKMDQKTIDSILTLDHDRLERTGEACGKEPIHVVIELAKRKAWTVHLCDYGTSGDATGNKDRVVGYGSLVFSP